MRIKRWIVLSLAAVLTTLMLTGCPWDQDRPGGGASSQPGGDGVIVVPPGGDDDDDGGDDPPVTYTITATAGPGGTAQPPSQTVAAGQNASVAVAASDGYCIRQITVDGADQFTAADASRTEYTVQFPAVDASHTVEASFAQVYTVTASIGAGGTVKLDGQPVADRDSAAFLADDTLTFTVEPEKGWQIEGVTANESPLTGTNGSYTYTVKGDCTIAVTFQQQTYTVTASIGEGGTGGNVSVDSASVEYGGTAKVTITPDAYYKIDSVQDNGTAISVADPNSVFTYTIQNVTENHAITVTFVSSIDPDTPSTWRVENGTLIVPQGASSTLINSSLITGSVTGIDLSQSGVTAIGDEAFYECYNLKSVTLGNVTSIGDSAFAFSSLQSVTMGDGVSIGGWAFLNCGNLQMVVTGDVNTIGEGAFDLCFNLHTVVMGDVGYIGNNAFFACDRLARIRLGSMPEVGYNAFFAATDSIEIYIGGLKEEDKETVEGWFRESVKVSILEDDPYNEWVNSAGGGNALAQYLTRLF